MGELQSPGELDGDVEDALERLFLASLVEPAIVYPVFQAAALDPLGEDARNSTQRAHVVAGGNVWMQAQVDPGLGFADEVLFSLLVGNDLRTRRLDRQVNPPTAVVDAVDQAHSTGGDDLLHLVEIHDNIAKLPFFGNLGFEFFERLLFYLLVISCCSGSGFVLGQVISHRLPH